MYYDIEVSDRVLILHAYCGTILDIQYGTVLDIYYCTVIYIYIYYGTIPPSSEFSLSYVEGIR